MPDLENSSLLDARIRAKSSECRLTNEDLAFCAQNGDNGAFRELVERNYQRCFRLALRIMHNRQEAEDQVQSAFLRALEHLHQFHYRAQFSSWLSQIVINQCRMRFREMQKTRLVGNADDCERSETRQLRETAPDSEQAVLYNEILSAVHSEIRRLPRVHREALALRYIDNLSLTDMADRLGVTVAAIKSRLFRGQLELRQRMIVEPNCRRNQPP